MKVNWQKLREEAGIKDYGNDILSLWKDSYTGILKLVKSACGMKRVGGRRGGMHAGVKKSVRG